MYGTGFTRKKVESLTLGEKLKKIRLEYRISLSEVAKNTGIRIQYLEHLEKGEYGALPADVYIRGFLRSYANVLGADPGALIRLYERERSIAKNLSKESEKKTTNAPSKVKRFSFFVVTPKVMIGTVIALLVFGVVTYLYREFQTFVSEPYLVLLEPSNGQTIESDKVLVSGKTDRDAKLFLNGELIFVSESGEFRKELNLQPGMNAVTVKVVNRFGKERSISVSILAVYEIPENTRSEMVEISSDSLDLSKKKKLSLSTIEKIPVTITVRADGKEIYAGFLQADESKEFECEKECLVDSTSQKGTFAEWNGGEAKPLGEKNGKITGVVFRAEEETEKKE